MKARLIAQTQISVPWPQCACVWPMDQPIPEGWEAIDLSLEPAFRGTHLVRGQAGDLGVCGHPRGSHDRHSGQCLVEDCSCLRFREAG